MARTWLDVRDVHVSSAEVWPGGERARAAGKIAKRIAWVFQMNFIVEGGN